MTKDRSKQLQDIIDALDHYMKVLRSHGLDDTAKIFAIAKLDLVTKLHGISDEELEAFCKLVDSAAGVVSEAEVIDFATHKT